MKDVLASLPVWLPGFVSNRLSSRRERPLRNVWLTIGDHYEPKWRNADDRVARSRVEWWRRRWPEIASRHADSAGRPPCYTFFYPEEEYHPSLLDPLAAMKDLGIGDVEIHLHHDCDQESRFLDRMSGFLTTLHERHGLLRKVDGKLRFGFIHGNWALDNSRPDGRWCGLNNEISLLRDLGCYADFTLPSAPHRTQTRTVNTIYWAIDDPEQPKSHDSGIPVRPGSARGDLLLIPGPLGFNFRGAGRYLPRLESGEIASYDPPVRGRAASWIGLAPQISGNVFLKLFTHGAQEDNAQALLEGGLDLLFDDLEAECARRGAKLFFASAWEMRNAVEALQTCASLN